MGTNCSGDGDKMKHEVKGSKEVKEELIDRCVLRLDDDWVF